MKTNKNKKTLCLAMILLLVAGWFHVNVCGAENVKQTISENLARGEGTPSLEESTEQNTTTVQDVTKSEKSQLANSKSDIFEDYLLPAALIPLMPVFIGMQIVCMFATKDASRCIGH